MNSHYLGSWRIEMRIALALSALPRRRSGESPCLVRSDVVTPDYIRARWAYSELPSGRYAGPGIPELTKKLDRRVPFDELEPAERDLLVSKWHEVRGPFFNPYFTSVAAFTVVQWNKIQLGYAFVIPEPFLRELGRPASAMVTFRQWIEAVPKVRLDSDHARYAADGPPPVSMHDHPVTIGRLSTSSPMVLLDGYHRVVRFWNNNDPAAKFAIYVPA
jgi:hypothetical protein